MLLKREVNTDSRVRGNDNLCVASCALWRKKSFATEITEHTERRLEERAEKIDKDRRERENKTKHAK